MQEINKTTIKKHFLNMVELCMFIAFFLRLHGAEMISRL